MAESEQLQLDSGPVTFSALAMGTGPIVLAKPVFDTSDDSVIHAGPVGAGLLLKQCNNAITYAQFLAMSEAARLAEAADLPVSLLREAGKSNGVANESMFPFVSNRNALAETCTPEQMAEIFARSDAWARKTWIALWPVRGRWVCRCPLRNVSEKSCCHCS